MHTIDTRNLGAFISSAFKFNSFALFCGAGTSFNSGLPLATQLQYEILSEVLLKQITKHCSWDSHPLGDNYTTSKTRIKNIIDSTVPFEVIMEGALMRNHNDILDIFNCKSPNLNHFYIANLARKGVLRTIFTTNFDTLIEQAIRKQNCCVLDTPEKIRDWNGVRQNRHLTEIIKLHGCVSNTATLKTTISKVAERDLTDSISPAIEILLKLGRHESVIFIGYSFSDHFDINPIIKNIVNSDKQIILVDHVENGFDIMSLSKVAEPTFISNFKGWKIKCNTSVFLEELANHYGLSSTTPSQIPDFDWKIYIKRWGEKTST